MNSHVSVLEQCNQQQQVGIYATVVALPGTGHILCQSVNNWTALKR